MEAHHEIFFVQRFGIICEIGTFQKKPFGSQNVFLQDFMHGRVIASYGESRNVS